MEGGEHSRFEAERFVQLLLLTLKRAGSVCQTVHGTCKLSPY